MYTKGKNFECKAYHGTKIELAKEIIHSKKFIRSTEEQEWLGDGVYFFQDDKRQAEDFCYKARKYENWSVIEVDISAEKLLDLIDTETFELFEEFAKQLKNKYKTCKDGQPRKLMNAVIINTLYKLNAFDLVRAVFPIPKRECAPRTNISPMQIQICVRNMNCIIIKGVISNGC